MRIIENTTQQVKKKLTELLAAYSINKNSKIRAKIGSEGMTVNYIQSKDGSEEEYEVIIETLECIEHNVYKKVSRTYIIPKVLIPEFNYTAADIVDLFSGYLVNTEEEYVDQRNIPINYVEDKSPIKNI